MMPKPTKARARERLQRALDAIPDLEKLGRRSPEFVEWRRNTKVAIINTFGDSSFHVKEFEKIM